MRSTTGEATAGTVSAEVLAQATAKVRDPRLDFFRGISMFIILVSHTRSDVLSDWIPARFGLSDAANMFVFISGYAGGMAFGGVYRRHGWWMGTARIAYRVWQLYIAQLAVVMIVAAIAVLADLHLRGDGDDYIPIFSLDYLFGEPRAALLGVVTLTYVPHYLDILPVYMVVLAMVPVAMLLARIKPWLVPAVSFGLWALAYHWEWNLPNEPNEPRGWFFDPLCWQLLFFSGFSISMKLIPRVPYDRRLFWAAVAMLGFGLVVTRGEIFHRLTILEHLEAWVLDHADKTTVDPLQYLHFLAIAYVAVSLLHGRLHLLHDRRLRPLVKCGQQALSVFLAGIVLSDLGGLAFDKLGLGVWQQVGVNLVTFAASFAVAYLAAWFKSLPWNRPPRGVSLAGRVPMGPFPPTEAVPVGPAGGPPLPAE